MSTYKTIAESNNFIVLDNFTKYYEVNEAPAVYQTEAALEREFIQDLKKNGNTNGLLRAKPRNDVKVKLLTFPSLRAEGEAIQTGTTAIATPSLRADTPPSLRAEGEAIQTSTTAIATPSLRADTPPSLRAAGEAIQTSTTAIATPSLRADTPPSLRAEGEAIQTGTTAIATPSLRADTPPSLRAEGEAIQKNNPTR